MVTERRVAGVKQRGFTVSCIKNVQPSPEVPAGGPARRIHDTSRVSLKQQLAMVKIMKQLSSERQEIKTRTSHRRRKSTAEEREIYKSQQRQAEAEARRTGQVTFKSLYG